LNAKIGHCVSTRLSMRREAILQAGYDGGGAYVPR
jgi:hypothetical protein